MTQNTKDLQEEALAQAKALANLLDAAIPIPGTDKRIGIDGIIGLIPGIGDSATAALASYIIYRAYQDGVSRWTLTRMIGNVLLDVLLGAVPVLGDLADFFWKANLRNMALWTGALERGRKRRQVDRLVVLGFVMALLIVVGGAVWLSVTIATWLWRQLVAAYTAAL